MRPPLYRLAGCILLAMMQLVCTRQTLPSGSSIICAHTCWATSWALWTLRQAITKRISPKGSLCVTVLYSLSPPLTVLLWWERTSQSTGVPGAPHQVHELDLAGSQIQQPGFGQLCGHFCQTLR